VTARRLVALLIAGAVFAGCGGPSATPDPLAAMHLQHSSGPIPTNAAVYAPGLNRTQWAECNDLWGYLRSHPHALVPGISSDKVNTLLTAGDLVTVRGNSANLSVLNGYLTACMSLFSQ